LSERPTQAACDDQANAAAAYEALSNASEALRYSLGAASLGEQDA
jgi:hypothetical protein